MRHCVYNFNTRYSIKLDVTPSSWKTIEICTGETRSWPLSKHLWQVPALVLHKGKKIGTIISFVYLNTPCTSSDGTTPDFLFNTKIESDWLIAFPLSIWLSRIIWLGLSRRSPFHQLYNILISAAERRCIALFPLSHRIQRTRVPHTTERNHWPAQQDERFYAEIFLSDGPNAKCRNILI